MRYINIDLSSDNYLQQPRIFGGYAGEHNETVLQVKLPDRMMGIECSGYRFDFQTSEDNKISSPLIQLNDDGILSFSLSEQLTVAGNLLFNIVAILSDKDVISLISKTNMVVLYIGDSPDGNSVLPDPDGYKDEILKMIDARIAEITEVKITVDQTYNPESENPQSGKAVAEAISGAERILTYETYSEANEALSKLDGDVFVGGIVVIPSGDKVDHYKIEKGYNLLTSEPADWQENLENYYGYSNDVDFTGYFKIKNGLNDIFWLIDPIYVQVTEEPDNWSTQYQRYYYKVDYDYVVIGELIGYGTDWTESDFIDFSKVVGAIYEQSAEFKENTYYSQSLCVGEKISTENYVNTKVGEVEAKVEEINARYTPANGIVVETTNEDIQINGWQMSVVNLAPYPQNITIEDWVTPNLLSYSDITGNGFYRGTSIMSSGTGLAANMVEVGATIQSHIDIILEAGTYTFYDASTYIFFLTPTYRIIDINTNKTIVEITSKNTGTEHIVFTLDKDTECRISFSMTNDTSELIDWNGGSEPALLAPMLLKGEIKNNDIWWAERGAESGPLYPILSLIFADGSAENIEVRNNTFNTNGAIKIIFENYEIYEGSVYPKFNYIQDTNVALNTYLQDGILVNRDKINKLDNQMSTLDNKVNSLSSTALKRKIVNSKPDFSMIPYEKNTIYMVPKDSTNESNIYEEYLGIESVRTGSDFSDAISAVQVSDIFKFYPIKNYTAYCSEKDNFTSNGDGTLHVLLQPHEYIENYDSYTSIQNSSPITGITVEFDIDGGSAFINAIFTLSTNSTLLQKPLIDFCISRSYTDDTESYTFYYRIRYIVPELELIGTSKCDLSGYVTSETFTSKTLEIQTALDDKVDKNYIDGAIGNINSILATIVDGVEDV